MIIGVLTSLLIAQVLARRSRLKTPHEIRNHVSVALFAHLLAGLAIVAALLSAIGAIGSSEDIRRLWVIMAATIVAVGVSQWIEWFWARNRRLLRRRIRTEITVNAWSIHRLSAFIPLGHKAHRRPITKLVLHLLFMSVIVVAAATASMELLSLVSTHNFPPIAATAAYISTTAILSTTCVLVASVAIAAQVTQVLEHERRWSCLVWILGTVWVGLPTTLLVAFTPWYRPQSAILTTGALVSLALPFVPLVLPMTNHWSSLHRHLAAGGLMLIRRRRLTLIRDLWAIERKASRKARAHRVRKTSLRHNRPLSGIGSIDFSTSTFRAKR
ncbi:hypothetical protein [Agreia bicolorata]|nr:hypothetical protein [Agreia bicolorata]KJC64250.1 hypothetical protein TZ00_07135 [Agreia bicolorata]